MHSLHIPALLITLALATQAAAQQDLSALKVCTSTPNLGALVREIGAEAVEITVFARPGEDPHFVDAKPSFVRALSRADLLVIVGLQLEIGWVPTLLRQAHNARVQPGNRGYLDASQAIRPLEILARQADRSEGDVHPLGNPHYLVDPIPALEVAALIGERLSTLRPQQADRFAANLANLREGIGRALVGDQLYHTYEFEKLAALFARGRLLPFLESQDEAQLLGGWLAGFARHRGSKVVADHNAWPYFTQRFGLSMLGFIEPRPGIPPSTRHLRELLQQMQAEDARILITVPFYDSRHADFVLRNSSASRVQLATQVTRGQSYLATLTANVESILNALDEQRDD